VGLIIMLFALEKALKPSNPPYLPYPLAPTPPNPNSWLTICIKTSFTTNYPLEVSSISLYMLGLESTFPKIVNSKRLVLFVNVGDTFIYIFEGNNWKDWSKNFFIHNRGGRGGINNYSRLYILYVSVYSATTYNIATCLFNHLLYSITMPVSNHLAHFW